MSKAHRGNQHPHTGKASSHPEQSSGSLPALTRTELVTLLEDFQSDLYANAGLINSMLNQMEIWAQPNATEAPSPGRVAPFWFIYDRLQLNERFEALRAKLEERAA